MYCCTLPSNSWTQEHSVEGEVSLMWKNHNQKIHRSGCKLWQEHLVLDMLSGTNQEGQKSCLVLSETGTSLLSWAWCNLIYLLLVLGRFPRFLETSYSGSFSSDSLRPHYSVCICVHWLHFVSLLRLRVGHARLYTFFFFLSLKKIRMQVAFFIMPKL